MEKNNTNDTHDINDNAEILNLLKSRLELGKKTYGHGVRVNDKDIDWELMALEEMLDGLIYTTAAIIRYRRKRITEK